MYEGCALVVSPRSLHQRTDGPRVLLAVRFKVIDGAKRATRRSSWSHTVLFAQLLAEWPYLTHYKYQLSGHTSRAHASSTFGRSRSYCIPLFCVKYGKPSAVSGTCYRLAPIESHLTTQVACRDSLIQRQLRGTLAIGMDPRGFPLPGDSSNAHPG